MQLQYVYVQYTTYTNNCDPSVQGIDSGRGGGVKPFLKCHAPAYWPVHTCGRETPCLLVCTIQQHEYAYIEW